MVVKVCADLVEGEAGFWKTESNEALRTAPVGCGDPRAMNGLDSSGPGRDGGASAVEPCLGIVMPVYNELGTVAEVLHAVLRQGLVREVIIVDDGSSDGTWQKLEKEAEGDRRIRLFRHEKNQGKGAALRTGFAQASAPFIVVQDADLEYDPSEYAKLVAPLLGGQADVVFGSRFIGSEAHRVLYFWHFLGNRILTALSNMATNLNLTDMEAGFKAFRREVLQRIKLRENRFGFEPEVIAKVSRMRLRIYEVGISYHGRTYAKGKKIAWRDGFSALRCVVQYNCFPGEDGG
jgi:glycosyltransferase involved in cell wall biosynthesis